MIYIKYRIFILVSLILIGSCQSDEGINRSKTNLDPSIYFEELNVTYGNEPGQNFDIYLPADRDLQTKIIVLVHGGGWTSGDKTEMNGFKNYLRTELPNYGILNLNYRLANQETKAYPMQINDITSVVNHLINNQNYYVIDDELGFIGVSAGAHLSMLWSYAFDTNEMSKMVCSIVGPSNFTDPAYLNSNNPTFDMLLALYGEDATIEYLEEVSPYHQVSNTAPPTILFHGGQDPLIPTSQGNDMHSKLNDLNITNEYTLYPNAGHGWSGIDLLDTTVKLKAFIQAYLN